MLWIARGCMKTGLAASALAAREGLLEAKHMVVNEVEEVKAALELGRNLCTVSTWPLHPSIPPPPSPPVLCPAATQPAIPTHESMTKTPPTDRPTEKRACRILSLRQPR